MTKENLTLEQTLRKLFATGYDPVKIDVHARGLNEDSIEVVVAGNRYLVRGNDVNLISASTIAQAVSNAGVPTAEEGNANSPKSDTAGAVDVSDAPAAAVAEAGAGDAGEVATGSDDAAGAGSAEAAADLGAADGDAGFSEQAGQDQGGFGGMTEGDDLDETRKESGEGF